MRILLLGLGLATGIGAAAGAEGLREQALQSFGPLPPAPEAPPALVELGRQLFAAPLSTEGNQSCLGCHDPAKGGADGREVALGHAWQTAPRNTSTVLNASLNAMPSWDLLDGMESPALSGLLAMKVDAAQVAADPALASGLAAAFPRQEVTVPLLAEAIDTYLATLVTPAPFDAWLEGDDAALTAEAREGLQLFLERGCYFCHYGLTLGGDGYYPFGLVDAEGTQGFVLSDTSEAGLDFRAAPLRNVALTAPYFHSGKVADLGVAVSVMAESQLGAPLSPEETAKIVAFLESLTGTAAP